MLLRTVPTVEVTGQVMTFDSGDPVVGADVTLNCLTSPIYGVRGTTDENGWYSIRIAPGEAIRRVTTMGNDESLYGSYDYPRMPNITIPPGIDELKLEPFRLTPRQTVNGMLQRRRPSGAIKAIANATVVFHDKETGRIVARAKTDHTGAFSTRVRNWKTIQENPRTASRYAWSILESANQLDSGILKQDLSSVDVISIDNDTLTLEKSESVR